MKNLSAAELRRRRGVYTMAILSLLAFIGFGLIPASGRNVTYGFILDKEWILIHQWVIGAKSASQLFAGLRCSDPSLRTCNFGPVKRFA